MMRRAIETLVALALVAASATAEAQGMWNYCGPLGAYYPYVTNCPVPWQQTPAYAPGPPPPGAPPPGVAVPPGAIPPPGPVITGRPPAIPAPGPETLSPADQQRAEERQTTQHARGAEIGMQREQDAADGYRTVTVASTVAGFKKTNSRVIITGYYSSADRPATLGDSPDATARVVVIADKLARAGQSMLADCANCRITIWARKGCAKAVLGNTPDAPCFVLERVKKDTYEANTPIFR